MMKLSSVLGRVARAKNFIALSVLVFAAWEVLPRALRIPPYVLPSPSNVYGVYEAKLPLLLAQTVPTLYEMAMGFIVAVVIGVVLGVAIGQFTIVRETVYPLLIILNSVPKIALAPLIIIWLGFGMVSIVTIVVLVSFFPILINTIVGVTSVQPEMIELVRTMTKSRTKEFLRVRLPCSVPYIFASMKTAATIVAVGAIFAEFIVGQSGLGFVILSAQQSLDVAMIFAALILLVIVTLGFFGVLIVIERVMMPWRKDFDML